ncbi:retrovirus-related pol polyprotein from transposon TNT 1-94 [Tanacetum coccineum]
MSMQDYLKRSVWYPDSGCSRHMTGVKQYLHRYSKESGPKVVFGDNSSGDTEGYGLVNCNGITFTRVAYVNGLKHNLISISQLCDANFKVLFTKTQGTIFNQNNEVVLIAPRRRDVYALICHLTMKTTILISLPEQRQVSIIVKRHGKTAYDVFKGRSHDISYFYMFGCHVHIYNHKDHLGKFNEKPDDGFFLGYSPVAKVFKVFNIRRQEMEETYHVTFSEDDEAISQSSTEEPHEFTSADNHLALSELDHLKSANNLKLAEFQDTVINEPISEVQPLLTNISPLTDDLLQPLVP